MEKIIERKVFDASIRNEMAGFRFELEEESQEISVLKNNLWIRFSFTPIFMEV